MSEFRGSARSSGFDAISLPDNARRVQESGNKRIEELRRTYQQSIANKASVVDDMKESYQQTRTALNRNINLTNTYEKAYEQALRKKYEQKLTKQKTQDKYERSRYDRLSTFSKEAGKLGKEMYEQHKEQRQRDGMAIIFNTGLTAEELQTLRKGEDGLQAEHAATNAIINRLKQNGASASEIKQIQELDGWILYGAQKELARRGGDAFRIHLQSKEVRTKKYDLGEGKKLSLQKALENGDQGAYIKIRGMIEGKFLERYQGYDLAFAEEYLFPGMREVRRNDDINFASVLQEQFEKNQEEIFQTAVSNMLADAKDGNSFAFQDLVRVEAGSDSGPGLGIQRKKIFQTFVKMVQNGAIDNPVEAINLLYNQQFTINGKQVSYIDQFNKNDSQLITDLSKVLHEKNRFRVAQESLAEAQLFDRLEKEAVRQAKGDGLSNDEAQYIINTLAAKGLSPRGVLQDLLVTRSLPVDRDAQYQMLQDEIAMGATFTEAQIAAKFPALTPTQRQQVVSATSMNGSGNGSKGLKSYTDTISQAIKTASGTANLVDPGFMATGMIGIMKREFTKEFFRRRQDPKYGNYTDDQIAQELMLNHLDDLNANGGKGIYERIKSGDKIVTGTGAGFVQVTKPPTVDSPLWSRTTKLIDTNPSVLNDKPLLGDINDPNSWASQIPEIIKTGQPPAWLTSLSRYTNTPWKILFNRQAALYGNYRLPLSRIQDAAEGISPGFLNRIGVAASGTGIIMGSVNQARAQGAQGLEVYRPLLNLIASYESSNDTVHGGYDAMNLGGTHGGSRAIGSNTGAVYFKKPLIQMTVGEIMDKQAAGQLHAAGRYQFLGSTLQDVFNRGNPGGISRDSLFDAATQDKLAVTYIRMTMRDFPGDPTSGIRGRWIGVKDNLTYQQTQDIVNRIQQDTRVQGTAFANHEIDPAIYAHSANRK